MLKLDFRTKLLMTITLSLIYVQGNLQYRSPVSSLAVILIPFIFLATEKKWQSILKNLPLIVVVWALVSYVFPKVHFNSGLYAVSMIFTGFILRIIPGGMMGLYTIITTPMSDLVESLRRMKMPDAVTIPVSVMFRFFYSTIEDYRQIKEAMKLHNLNLCTLWRKPAKLIEYRAVPLLMCSVKASNDVAVSAMTRGMQVGQARTTISNAKLKAHDYFFIILSIFTVILHICSLYN